MLEFHITKPEGFVTLSSETAKEPINESQIIPVYRIRQIEDSRETAVTVTTNILTRGVWKYRKQDENTNIDLLLYRNGEQIH